jgi:hypothetical protein
MRIAFAEAVAAKNLPGVEALTSFPLRNVVEHSPPSFAKPSFPNAFEQNGYADMADCLKSTPLEPAAPTKHLGNAWLINCNGNIFYFSLRNGRWTHVEFENINE